MVVRFLPISESRLTKTFAYYHSKNKTLLVFKGFSITTLLLLEQANYSLCLWSISQYVLVSHLEPWFYQPQIVLKRI